MQVQILSTGNALIDDKSDSRKADGGEQAVVPLANFDAHVYLTFYIICSLASGL